MASDLVIRPYEHDDEGHDLAGLRRWVATELRTRLAPHRHYHDVAHTLDDVLPAAERLAREEALPPRERELVRAAVLLHDTGYVEGPTDHEEASARIAARRLPAFGFSADEVARVVALILATRLGAPLAGPAERVMADADLDLLGREDFWERSLALRREWAGDGVVYGDADWLRHQIRFLEGHRYGTEAARRLRRAGKEANLRRLRAALRALPGERAGR